MKGFLNEKPREHKLLQNWSVDKVLKTILRWGNNWELSEKQLTWKLAMLLALSASNRVSELKSLDTRYMKQLPDGVSFKLTTHKKTEKQKFYQG